ncbi:MAG: FKBP-type peptidylprolyl isomerase [Bacteroidetes bacterium]|nr:MAG: FKBP-type peptidylprolyl isomerase [Bacteroidota bacterium]
MRELLKISSFLLLSFLLLSCGEEEKKPRTRPYTTEEVKEASKQMGQWDSQRQKDEIEMYIKNHGWEMKETGTGLYYMYMKNGAGEAAKDHDQVFVSYKVFLLSGTLCYSSETDGPRVVRIGSDYVESGLHEALKMMKVGDQLRVILPSHLAHGLTGDDDKIPPRSSVLYEIELLEKK